MPPRSKEEQAEYKKRWKKANPEKHRAMVRRRHLKKYGLTIADYDALLDAQGGVCAICGGVNPSGQRLAVDHDHETGAVRGLLCHACNAGIGKLRDDPALLDAAAQYLRKHKE